MKRICTIEGCSQRHYGRGWCETHYARWRRHGDPRITKFRIGCKVFNCTAKHHSDGFCGAHFYRFKKWGDPLARTERTLCSVDGCDNLQRGRRPFCNKHYQRFQKYGDPRKRTTGTGLSDEARFWRNVRKTPNCWIWTAGKFTNGYGVFRFQGKQQRASRVSFFFANGYWPEPQCLHSCDVPTCVNPDHLRAGTQKENMADMIMRGRQKRGKSSTVLA